MILIHWWVWLIWLIVAYLAGMVTVHIVSWYWNTPSLEECRKALEVDNGIQEEATD